MSLNVALEVFLSGVWTTVPLYSATPATRTRGTDPYSTSWPRPAEITCEINNDNLAWDPARPESPIYGLAGRATPARLMVGGSALMYGEATSWEPEASPEHRPGQNFGRAWVMFTAAGPLQRIQDWTDPVRSPMWRTISARSTSIGHWPLEEGRTARTLTNTVPAGKTGTIKGTPSPGDDERPAGAAQTIQLSADTQLAGTFKTASSTAGWQLSFSLKVDALPAPAVWGRILRWTTTNGYTWIAELSDIAWQWTVTDSTGAVLWTSAVGYSVYPPTSWVTMRIKVSVSGGTVTVEPAWYQQGAATPVGTTGTFPGTAGALRAWWHDGNAVLDGCWLSHVFAVTGVTDDLQNATALAVFNGYSGELALDRFFRNMSEIGITGLRIGEIVQTPAMGPQPIASTINILKECMVTDGGRIDDTPGQLAVTMRTRRAMQGKAAVLVLDFAAGHVAPPLRRTTSTENVANVVTVKNGDLGEAVVSQTTGPNSTAVSPAGIGEKKATVDVNLAFAADLADRADWELNKGALEGPRILSVTVDLLANPGLTAAVVAVREGEYIQIVNFPPDTVHLLVTGIKDEIGETRRTVTFQTEPYDVYRTGLWDNGIWRWDAKAITLAAPVTTTATSLTTSSPEQDDVLSTTAVPYDMVIGGERITATAVTAPAGTGPYTQTITATRSVNGVVKAQTTGTLIKIYNARRWGL